MPDNTFSRRHFFYGSLLAGAVPAGGFSSVASLQAAGYKSPNQKLNIAGIGAGGRPFSDLTSAEADGRENIVALADVDFARGAQGFNRWPKAEKYRDFRQMLDKSGKDIDAVVIGTADHMHTYCALACMQLGKHVYVEKPLTRTAWEARLLTEAAAKYNVATQMGNQGYSHDATRVACEILWSGEIGDVREVHAWNSVASWPQGMTKIPPPTPVPDTLSWDLWLGTAAWREYTAGDEEYNQFIAARNAKWGRGGGGGGGGGGGSQYGFYMPFNWRGFYDFGSGLIGDWGVHILGPANWGLQLSPQSLVSVECVRKDSLPPFTFPDELVLRYDFAARGSMPPVSVYWHNVNGTPYIPPGMTAEQARKIPDTGPQVGPQGGGRGGAAAGAQAQQGGPEGAAAARGAARGARGGDPEAPGGPGAAAQQAAAARGGGGGGGQGIGYNCIFVGSKGYMGTSGRGESVGLLPGSRWAEYQLPNAYLSRSPGASTGSNSTAHARDWVRACKGGAPACSNFSIAGPYTEWLVSGSAAVHFQGRLMWDGAKGEFTNNAQANQWVRPTYRRGWEVRL